jgi:hypothetical protein
VLGWMPEFTFDQTIAEMVEHDLELARAEAETQDAAPGQ